MSRPVRLTLLAALCWQRSAEITNGLVDLLIQLVHRINTRAESRVEGEMVADLRRVAGKQGILFRLAGVALEQPDETVRRAIYPVVGEGTLRDLVREAMAIDDSKELEVIPAHERRDSQFAQDRVEDGDHRAVIPVLLHDDVGAPAPFS